MIEYKVTKNDLIGQISDFPIEVVQKMVDCQVEQGNKPDVKVFQKYSFNDKNNGGFDWKITIDGGDFWENIIKNKNFDLFFQKYPKSNQVTIQKDMETNKLILNGIILPNGTEAKVSVEDGATIITFQKQEEKEPEFKRGDIIYVEEKDCGYIAIIKNIEDDVINVYSVLIMETNIVYTNEIIIRKNILSIRKASQSEESKIYQGLANQKQLHWNANEFKFEKYVWRAEKGGKFWFITSNGVVAYAIDNYKPTDNLYFNLRNYFETPEIANKALPLWKDFFKNLSL